MKQQLVFLLHIYTMRCSSFVLTRWICISMHQWTVQKGWLTDRFYFSASCVVSHGSLKMHIGASRAAALIRLIYSSPLLTDFFNSVHVIRTCLVT